MKITLHEFKGIKRASWTYFSYKIVVTERLSTLHAVYFRTNEQTVNYAFFMKVEFELLCNNTYGTLLGQMHTVTNALFCDT